LTSRSTGEIWRKRKKRKRKKRKKRRRQSKRRSWRMAFSPLIVSQGTLF